MSRVPHARLLVAALVLIGSPAAGETLVLDLPSAIALAHRTAPAAIAARGRVAEAEAHGVAAALAFTRNPELEVGAGPRLTDDRPVDVDLRIEQSLEPGQRGPRRAVARAERGFAEAEAAAALRALDLEVATAFAEVLVAERGAELARRGAELAERAAAVADRRRRAGDATDLDANLGRAALGRARAAVHAATSDRAAAAGQLARLVGAARGDVVEVRGELTGLLAPDDADRGPADRARPEVQALAAERTLASAEQDAARAIGRPELSLWASYQRDDTTSIVLGGLRMTLPLWNRGQGEAASARARERRAGEAYTAALRATERQAADGRARYDAAREAVALFERDVVPILDDSEQLLQRTLDAGQIAMPDYLTVRQELLAGRREYLERLRALAAAAIELRFGGVR